MPDNFYEDKELCEWYKRVFVIAGVWPLQSVSLIFAFWAVYSCLQVFMELTHLLYVFGDLDMIENIVELTWVFMVVPKLIVMRFSKKLSKLIIQIMREMDEKHFESTEEKDVYMTYNSMAKSFFMIMGPVTGVCAVTHYSRPLVFLLKTVLLFNESVPLILPYRTYLFFHIGDYFTLSLFWIYQIPMMFVNTFHPMSLGFVVFLVYHVCGQLSVLAIRIKNLKFDLGANMQRSGTIFRSIVEKHRNITGISNDINEVFNLLFLEELFMTTVMIIMTCHTAIVNSDLSDATAFLSYVTYACIMLALIYAYCAASEYLIMESTNVCEAYYYCQWYDLPTTYKKQLIICIIGARKPVYLVGGGFYIFSLSSFTNILKSAMSYISLLRSLI